MNTALIIVAILISIILLFAVLQWFSNRTYKPTKDEIRKIIQASIDGRLSLGEFDELSCVYIAYDKGLENIREKYNQIVNNPEYIDGEMTDDNMTPLNAAGKNKLSELINELSQVTT